MKWNYDGDACLGTLYIFGHNTNLYVADPDVHCSDLLHWSEIRPTYNISLVFLNIRAVTTPLKGQGWDLKHQLRYLSGLHIRSHKIDIRNNSTKNLQHINCERFLFWGCIYYLLSTRINSSKETKVNMVAHICYYYA